MITRKIFSVTLNVCGIKIVENKPQAVECPPIVIADTKPILDKDIIKELSKRPGLTEISREYSEKYYGMSATDFLEHAQPVHRAASQNNIVSD